MVSHHRLLVEPSPRRWPAWLTSALGVAVATVAAVLGAPALGLPVPDGVHLTGNVTPPARAAVTVAPIAAPVTVTLPAPPPLEVAPPTVRVHDGPFVGDCTLSDPLTPIYLCPGR